MYKGITLNQFVGELQRLAVEHGNDEISSIGSFHGKIDGMDNPFFLHLKEADFSVAVPAYQHDVRVHAENAQGQGPSAKGQEVVSLRDDLNGAAARVVADELRHVWARVGMTLDITPEEEKAIFEGEYLEGKAAVKRVVLDGRASLDGETYIPDECIRDFDDEYGTNYRKREDECAWSLDGDQVNSGGMVPGLDGLALPSVEQVEELVGQLRKYSKEEYDQHNNYIAQDLADAADVLSKLVSARAFLSADKQEGKVVNEVLADAKQRCFEGDRVQEPSLGVGDLGLGTRDCVIE